MRFWKKASRSQWPGSMVSMAVKAFALIVATAPFWPNWVVV